MSEPALASTILLVRDAEGGLEVFLVKRHRRSGFMPSAWVFPGGRVDPGDRLPDHRVRDRGAWAAFGVGGEDGRAALVAGVRETFEEAGIWLGTGALPAETRGPLAAGELALLDLLEAHDAVVDLDPLVPWARWVTPEGEGRRFDTVFSIVAVPPGVRGTHDATETVDSGWFRPSDVLAAGLGTMGLAPPTWWMLSELATLGSADVAVAYPTGRALLPVRPTLAADPERGFGILLPGHPDHPEPARPDLPKAIRLGEGGWVAER